MRMLGGGRRILFTSILLEGLFLAMLGAIGGFLLAHISLEFLNHFAAKTWHYSFTGRLFLWREIYVLLGALVLGTIAAFLPALAATRIPIARTLAA